MNDDTRTQVNTRVTGVSNRRWHQVLAFGCLPDGCTPAENPVMSVMPGTAFDVLP
jgi:hypothetical protein